LVQLLTEISGRQQIRFQILINGSSRANCMHGNSSLPVKILFKYSLFSPKREILLTKSCACLWKNYVLIFQILHRNNTFFGWFLLVFFSSLNGRINSYIKKENNIKLSLGLFLLLLCFKIFKNLQISWKTFVTITLLIRFINVRARSGAEPVCEISLDTLQSIRHWTLYRVSATGHSTEYPPLDTLRV
jgi:hypothetical protein